MKLVSMSRARHPDGQIVCGATDELAKFTTTPVTVFEVVSPDDEGRDRVVKLNEYQSILSIQTYVMVDRDRAGAVIMRRSELSWPAADVLGLGDVLRVPEAGIEVPLDELYEGVLRTG